MVAVIAEIDLTASVSITLVNYHERKQQERAQRRRKRQQGLVRFLLGGNRGMAFSGGLIVTSELFVAARERPALLVAGFALLALGMPPVAPR